MKHYYPSCDQADFLIRSLKGQHLKGSDGLWFWVNQPLFGLPHTTIITINSLVERHYIRIVGSKDRQSTKLTAKGKKTAEEIIKIKSNLGFISY